MRPVTMAVLDGLTGDEGLRHDRPAREVGVLEIKAGVEYRHGDAGARLRRDRRPRGLQTPREAVVVAEARVGRVVGPTGLQLVVEAADAVAEAAHVLERQGALLDGVEDALGLDRQDARVVRRPVPRGRRRGPGRRSPPPRRAARRSPRRHPRADRRYRRRLRSPAQDGPIHARDLLERVDRGVRVAATSSLKTTTCRPVNPLVRSERDADPWNPPLLRASSAIKSSPHADVAAGHGRLATEQESASPRVPTPSGARPHRRRTPGPRHLGVQNRKPRSRSSAWTARLCSKNACLTRSISSADASLGWP